MEDLGGVRGRGRQGDTGSERESSRCPDHQHSRGLPPASGAGHWVGVRVQLHVEGDGLVDVGVAGRGPHWRHGRGILGTSGPAHCRPQGAALAALPQQGPEGEGERWV